MFVYDFNKCTYTKCFVFVYELIIYVYAVKYTYMCKHRDVKLHVYKSITLHVYVKHDFVYVKYNT